MAYLLWHLLTEGAGRHPLRPAVSWRQTVLTYRDLDDQSTRLAALLAACGIRRGDRVAIDLPKSPQSVVAMLGVLKSGAAYVPVDPGAPARRAAYILKDCAVRGLITTTRNLRRLSDALAEVSDLKTILLADVEAEGEPLPAGIPGRIRRWEELAEVEANAGTEVLAQASLGVETDPAYLLYTSGSTGTPKGVILSHRNALAFVDWGAETFAVRPVDRLSNHAPHHFDLSVFDIYVALRSGACVVLVPDEIAPFPLDLARWIESEEISVWYSVPSALVRLLLHGRPDRFTYPKLRTILFAGEVFPVKYLRELMARLSGVEFYNLYGPTETNVCTYFQVPSQLAPEVTEIPIGRACANTEVFAIDESGRPAGPGQTGELYVRGPSVMLGYWGMPEKTRALLISNPLQPGFHDPAYRTGDLVQLEPDGCYRFLGRKDHMVKSRGYRIELGEIEQALYDHVHVKEAVVVPVPDEEIGTRLKAVIVPHAGAAVDPAELRAFCLGRLPKYMVPEEVVLRSELPRTSTGKTDRVAVARSLDPSVVDS